MPECPLQGFKKTYMTVFEKKKIIWTLGLDPDPVSVNPDPKTLQETTK